MIKIVLFVALLGFFGCNKGYINDSKAIASSDLLYMKTGIKAGQRYFKFKEKYLTQVHYLDVQEMKFTCEDQFFETHYKSKWFLVVNDYANLNIKSFKYGEQLTKRGKVYVLKPLTKGRWYKLSILASNGDFHFWFKHEDKTISLSNTDGKPIELLEMEKACEGQ